MREIPVSSLGGDKVRVEVDEDGDVTIADATSEMAAYIAWEIPTEALLAIVADRLREAPGAASAARECVSEAIRWLAAAEAARSPAPAQPDADQIGEGR